MQWPSALAIYLLFWVFSAFLVLPFHARTSHEAGETLVPGQADSAPAQFRPARVGMQMTALATVLFALFYVGYTAGIFDPRELGERLSPR